VPIRGCALAGVGAAGLSLLVVLRIKRYKNKGKNSSGLGRAGFNGGDGTPGAATIARPTATLLNNRNCSVPDSESHSVTRAGGVVSEGPLSEAG